MGEVLQLSDVTVRRESRVMLSHVTWSVGEGERWVVLGRNGAGKTTLVRVASLYLNPSAGEVRVLGETVGRTDVRRLRTRVGVASQAFADLLRNDVTAIDIVKTGKYAALEPWWHTYDDADRTQAMAELERLGAGRLAGQRFGTLSSGERQRVQLARTLMGTPELILLDEPAAGLDLTSREELLHRLAALAADTRLAPLVLVTHHTEEIPVGFTHVLLLSHGHVLEAGPLEEVLTAEKLSACFEIDLRLERRDGRWMSWAPRG